MDNLTYEFFIRRCQGCDRLKHGADTEIWEDMVIKHYNLQHATVGDFIITQKEFGKKLGEVQANLDEAYNKLIAAASKKKLNQKVIGQLLESKTVVALSSEPKEIFDALKSAFRVMNENNL